jgi:hypothetical protein
MRLKYEPVSEPLHNSVKQSLIPDMGTASLPLGSTFGVRVWSLGLFLVWSSGLILVWSSGLVLVWSLGLILVSSLGLVTSTKVSGYKSL